MVEPDLERSLAEVRMAWLAAGSAVERCPPTWREAIGEGPQAEAALAALAAHATQALFRPSVPALTVRPLLPRLCAPEIPPQARGPFRRLLAGKGDEARIRGLIWLAAGRGFVAHPADWLPGAGYDWAPAVYAPWLAWAAAAGPADRTRSDASPATLTAETWDDWSWVERRAMLVALRRTDPVAVRLVIGAKAGSEPAERRLILLEILKQGLSIDDLPVIEGLAADRSDRVRTLAGLLLARLGHGAGAGEAARELAGMVELTKAGLIHRHRQLTLKVLKTQAQETRRRELLALVPLPALAEALGAPEAALVEAAPAGEAISVLRFVELVATTGSDAACQALLDRILARPEAPTGLALPLAPRVRPQERAAALAKVVAREEAAHFPVSLAFAGETLGGVAMPAVAGSKAYVAFTDLLRLATGDDQAARTRAEAPLKLALVNLGLLLAPDAARALIAVCADAGLPGADPRLDPLHLNAALTP